MKKNAAPKPYMLFIVRAPEGTEERFAAAGKIAAAIEKSGVQDYSMKTATQSLVNYVADYPANHKAAKKAPKAEAGDATQ